MRRIIFSVLLGLFVAIPRVIYAWTTPINIFDSPHTYSRYPSICLDKMNNVHVVWDEEIQYSGNEEIFYRHYDGNSWGSAANLSRDSLYSEAARVVVDTLCHPHVIWCTWGFRGMCWTQWDSSSWTTPVRIYSDLPGEASWKKMAVDQFNRIHIVWATYPAEEICIWHGMYDGVSWSEPRNIGIDGYNCAGPDIAVDSKGNLHVVWSATPYDSLEPTYDWKVYYSQYDGISWSSPIIISGSYIMSLYPRIAIDSRDHLHVVWEVSHEGHHIYYTSFDGVSWSIPYKVSDESYEPVIASDLQNNVHVLWAGVEDTLCNIYFSFYNGTQWSAPFNISNSPANWLVDLATDLDDCLHAVWMHRVNLKTDIYYSKHVITGIDSPDDGGFAPFNYGLGQNFPNPFIQTTNIPYELSESTYVTLTISDITGRVVKRFRLGWKSKGYHTFPLNLGSLKNNEEGGAYGIYFYKIETGRFSATRKMIVLAKNF